MEDNPESSIQSPKVGFRVDELDLFRFYKLLTTTLFFIKLK